MENIAIKELSGSSCK